MNPKTTEAWAAAIARTDGDRTGLETLVERLVARACCRSAGVWGRAAGARGWTELAARDREGELLPPGRSRPDPGAPPPDALTPQNLLIELPIEAGSLLLQLAGWSADGELDEDAVEALLLLAGLVDAAAGRLPDLAPLPALPGGVRPPARPEATARFLGSWLRPLDEATRRAVLASLRPPSPPASESDGTVRRG